MTNNWDRKVSKKQLLGKSSLGHVSQGNKLSTQNVNKTKNYNFEGGVVSASHRIIDATDVQFKTDIHPLNPRNQRALNVTSVAETLASIKANGIDTDCIGIWSDDNKEILVIEGSVRRFCAIETNNDYPIWVLPAGSASNNDIRRLISDADSKKPHSLREKGASYIKEALELDNEAESLTIDELAKLIGIGRETVRKAMQAYKLNSLLLEAIPDYEGVSNSIYPELAKVEKAINKTQLDMNVFVKQVKDNAGYQQALEIESIGEAQKRVLDVIQTLSKKTSNKTPVKKAETIELASYSDRFKSAILKVSPNGRKHTFEFSRIEKSVVDEIENFIREKLKS